MVTECAGSVAACPMEVLQALVSPRKGSKWVTTFSKQTLATQVLEVLEDHFGNCRDPSPPALDLLHIGGLKRGSPYPLPDLDLAAQLLTAVMQNQENGERERDENKSQGPVTVGLGEGQVGRGSKRGCKTVGKLALKTVFMTFHDSIKYIYIKNDIL